jgi:DNA-3-methyladenine glycosylase
MTTGRLQPVAQKTFVSAKCGRDFFSQPAKELAAALVGTVMVRRVGRAVRRARIVETEAYLGPKDLASHSSKGRTARTEVMFGAAGHAYVYFIYGMHWMFNVVAGATGEAHAVLVRAAEPLDGWQVDLTGPAKFAHGFAITGADNGRDLVCGASGGGNRARGNNLVGHDIYFIADPDYRPRIVKRKRVGVDYSKHWKHRLLRFIDVTSPVAKTLRY